MSENNGGLTLKRSHEHTSPPMQTPAQRLADAEEAIERIHVVMQSDAFLLAMGKAAKEIEKKQKKNDE